VPRAKYRASTGTIRNVIYGIKHVEMAFSAKVYEQLQACNDVYQLRVASRKKEKVCRYAGEGVRVRAVGRA